MRRRMHGSGRAFGKPTPRACHRSVVCESASHVDPGTLMNRFADSSAIPTYRLAQATSRHVKVALTGDGGDELFAGYPRYQTVDRLQSYDRLPGFVQSMTANRACNGSPVAKVNAACWSDFGFGWRTLRTQPDSRYIHWISCFQKQGRDRLLSPDFFQHTF